MIEESIVGVPVVEITTQDLANRICGRQYYALLRDRVVLVRLEDSSGKLARNMYTASNYIVGPRIPNRSVEEWEAVLVTDDTIEILGALTWLSGIHGNEEVQGFESVRVRVDLGESGYGEMIKQLMGRKSVRERLSQLINSENHWIRVAAELVANI